MCGFKECVFFEFYGFGDTLRGFTLCLMEFKVKDWIL
jgi:hypothetical protein